LCVVGKRRYVVDAGDQFVAHGIAFGPESNHFDGGRMPACGCYPTRAN
jgi:hypothetical protein